MKPGYLRFKGDGALPKQIAVKRRRQLRLEAARQRDEPPTQARRPKMKPVPRGKVRINDYEPDE